MTVHTGITLDDIVTGTEFHYNGMKWRKANTCKGFGPTGSTLCEPHRGGKFQTSDKLTEFLKNNIQVEI